MTFQFSTIYPITNFTFGMRNQSSTRILIQHYHSPPGNIKSSIKGAGGAVLLYSTLYTRDVGSQFFNNMNATAKVIEANPLQHGYGRTEVFFPFTFLFNFCMEFGYSFICITLFIFSFISRFVYCIRLSE
ncbi:hypothetical protein BDW75DRAFT_154681 [Aspergillus navahoensis]